MLVARDEDLAVDVAASGLHVPEGLLDQAATLWLNRLAQLLWLALSGFRFLG